MVAFFAGILLAAFTQVEGSYWALTFTSLVVVTFGPGECRRAAGESRMKLKTLLDLSFATGQLIVSNSGPFEYQGIAGGVVSMITNYSYVVFTDALYSTLTLS